MADAPCVAAVAAAACCVAQAVGSRRLLSLKPGDAVRSVRDIQLSGGVMIYKGCVGIVEKSRGDKPGTIEAKVNGVLFDASINEVVPEPNPENPLLGGEAKPEEGRLAQQQQQQQQQPPRHQEEITVEVETRGESEDIAPSQPPLYDAKPGGSQASPPSVKGPPQRRTSVPYLFEASVQSASPMGASARYARSVASLGSTYKSPPSAPEACASPKSPATSHFGRSLRSTSRVKVPPDAGYYLPIKGFRSESERAFSAPPADTRSGYAGHAPLPLQQQRSFSVAPALSSTLKTPIRRPTASRSFETSPAISGIVPSYRGPTGTPFVLQPQTDRWVAARETSSQTELGDGRRSSNRGKKQQKKRGKDSKKNRGSSSSSSVGDSASSSSSGSSSDSSSSSSSGDTSSGEGERRKRKEKKKQKKKKKKKEKQKEKNKKKEEEKAKEKLRGGDEKRGSRQPALGAAAENPHRRQTVPQTHVASPGEVLLLLGLMRRGRASLSHQAAASSCWNDTEVREELVKLRAVEDILPSSISRFVNHLVTDHDFEHDTSVTPEILCAAVDASRIELAEDRERAQSISFAVPEPRTRPKKVYCASSPESRGGDAPQPRMTPAPVPTPSFANSLSPLQEGVTLSAVV
ncbi:hypothetical protein DIPPA_34033 [Diplonema papillatum]|nr:hypothetical protein DIPPA_34033 [Diplonema papillatum]